MALQYIDQLFPSLASDSTSGSGEDWQLLALHQFELAVFTRKSMEETTSWEDMVYEASVRILRGVLGDGVVSGFASRRRPRGRNGPAVPGPGRSLSASSTVGKRLGQEPNIESESGKSSQQHTSERNPFLDDEELSSVVITSGDALKAKVPRPVIIECRPVIPILDKGKGKMNLDTSPEVPKPESSSRIRSRWSQYRDAFGAAAKGRLYAVLTDVLHPRTLT